MTYNIQIDRSEIDHQFLRLKNKEITTEELEDMVFNLMRFETEITIGENGITTNYKLCPKSF